MSASTLRAAAALIRARANAATPGPWFPWDGWGPTADGLMGFSRLGPPSGERVLHHDEMQDIYATRADAEHIATMHPTVALALADLLDTIAKVGPVDGGAEWEATVTLAKAYLGVTA